ncbi:hypothetical protein P8843_13870 [Bacillus inaquosorum]|nr:hypothetical protein [Bacillus inaquosorum]
MEIELLQSKYFVTKTREIELYGKYLSVINEEFSKRDLTEIPTEKLYDMAMKTISSSRRNDYRLKDKGTLDDTFASLHESYVEWNV